MVARKRSAVAEKTLTKASRSRRGAPRVAPPPPSAVAHQSFGRIEIRRDAVTNPEAVNMELVESLRAAAKDLADAERADQGKPADADRISAALAELCAQAVAFSIDALIRAGKFNLIPRGAFPPGKQ